MPKPPRKPDAPARPKDSRWEGKEKPDWLGRALGRAGVLQKEEAEDAIKAGRVTVNGRKVTQPLAPVPPGAQVRLDGQLVSLEAAVRVLAFHKPRELLVSTVAQHGTGTVFDYLRPLLPPELASFTWHAVGRLDRDTTGLLLLTNSERVAAHVTSPDSHLAKRYVATVQGEASDEKLEPLRRGLELDGERLRPARARLREPRVVEVVLTEGRHHQVKRMLGEVGLPVRALHREAVGGLELDLPEGAWRLLTDAEVRDGLGWPPASGG